MSNAEDLVHAAAGPSRRLRSFSAALLALFGLPDRFVRRSPVDIVSAHPNSRSRMDNGVRPPSGIRARQIIEADTAEVVDLLTRGFAQLRTHQFWEEAIAILRDRAVPEGYPRYGFVMESEGRLVGVLLTIFSTVWPGVARS